MNILTTDATGLKAGSNRIGMSARNNPAPSDDGLRAWSSPGRAPAHRLRPGINFGSDEVGGPSCRDMGAAIAAVQVRLHCHSNFPAHVLAFAKREGAMRRHVSEARESTDQTPDSKPGLSRRGINLS
jgi:hypothetical protein